MINFKESNVKVNYSDLEDLGFERIEISDYVHMSQYGYPYFILAYGEEDDKVSMEWSPVTREVNPHHFTKIMRLPHCGIHPTFAP